MEQCLELCRCRDGPSAAARRDCRSCACRDHKLAHLHTHLQGQHLQFASERFVMAVVAGAALDFCDLCGDRHDKMQERTCCRLDVL